MHKPSPWLADTASLLPSWGWFGVSLSVAILGLLFSIARRAKTLEDEATRAHLDEAREMNLHQFFTYIGISLRDGSPEGNNNAQNAINKLRSLLGDGSVDVWGAPIYYNASNSADWHPPYCLIERSYWNRAYIYPRDVLLAKDPLRIKTSSEPAIREPLTPVYNRLHMRELMIRRSFRKNEFKGPHKPMKYDG